MPTTRVHKIEHTFYPEYLRKDQIDTKADAISLDLIKLQDQKA